MFSFPLFEWLDEHVIKPFVSVINSYTTRASRLLYITFVLIVGLCGGILLDLWLNSLPPLLHFGFYMLILAIFLFCINYIYRAYKKRKNRGIDKP